MSEGVTSESVEANGTSQHVIQESIELDNKQTIIENENVENHSNNNNNNNNNNYNSPSISPSMSSSKTASPSITLNTEEQQLKRAEKALQKLLDHSHELTTKLREGLHSNKHKNKDKNRNRNIKHRNNNDGITEELENRILENDQDDNNSIIRYFENDQQPSTITGGTMYRYQIEALNWMIQLYELNKNNHGINGILADDMGLGKTLETISFISYLKEYRMINGPHIIIVPLTTATNWMKEFNHWNPKINVFLFHGDQYERQQLINTKIKELELGSMDVLITSYEIAMIEKNILNRIKWEYLIIDEAHRIKNDESKLSKVVRLFNTKYRLLLTGTPLQNNMKELWSLLNFLSPQLFTDSSIFTEHFSNNNLQNNPEIVDKLHRILRPFILRRLKKDVCCDLPPKIEISLYCGMSKLQKKWYKNVLSRNLDEINNKSKSKTRLLNILMQLRKVCNHPYLFEGAEDGPPYIEGNHLYENCGKLSLLNKLLIKLFAQNSRVLIFSQMTRMLDILEDYMILKGFGYCRIDGSTKQYLRDEYMDSFNAPNSDKMVFLLSTRAGGLGINLQTADIVILYDSDWNPMMDIQAMDRAHRIGQNKTVFVYRMITSYSVEEKILDRCMRKLYLNAVVVKKGGTMIQQSIDKKNNANSLKEMVKFGAEYILRTTESSISDQDIDDIIKIGKERTEENKSKIQKAWDHNIMDFRMDINDEHNYQTYEGTDYSNLKKIKKQKQALIINHGPRQRNLNVRYHENYYFKNLLQKMNKKEESPNSAANKKIPKTFKVSFHSKYKYDFQFVTNLDGLHDLEKKQFDANEQLRVQLIIAKEKFKKNCMERKETLRINKMIEAQKMIKLRREIAKNGGDANIIKSKSVSSNYDNNIDLNEYDEKEEWDKIKDEIEDKIDFLTKKEEREIHRLTKDAFDDWSYLNWNQFIKSSVEFGKNSVDKIAETIDNKSLFEVRRFHEIFWKKYKKLDNWKKLIDRIEGAENKREERERFNKLLNKKVIYYKNKKKKKKDDGKINNALSKLKLIYEIEGEKGVKIGNGYTKLFDRFIILKIEEYGFDSWQQIKTDTLKCKLFWNNWLLRSKTINEIKNRALKLIHLLDIAEKKKNTKKKQKKNKNQKKTTKKKKNKNEKKKKKKKESKSNCRSNTNSRDSSVSSVLSNKSRKRLTKKFIDELVETLKAGTMLEIYDDFDNKWIKCRVIKHCDRDIFTLYDMSDQGTFDENFKNLQFRILEESDSDHNDDEDDEDDDIEMKKTVKLNGRSRSKSKSRSKSRSKSVSKSQSVEGNKNMNKKKRKRMDEESSMPIPEAKRRKIELGLRE